MFCLRQITFSLILFFSLSLLAAAGSVRSTLDFQNSYGSASSLTQADANNSQGISQTVELISPTLKKYWTLTSSIKIAKMDAALLNTKNAKGADIQWSKEDNQLTNVGTLGLTFSQGPSTSTIRYGQSLDNSVFQSRMFEAATIWNLNSMTTTVGLLFSKAEMDRPPNFVFDNLTPESSLTWKERPTRLTRNRWTASVDQIWTDLYKTRTEIFYQQRNQERPQSAGLVFKNSISLNSRQVVRADLGTATEDRQQSLQDERGYFQMNWLETAFSQAITYNLWLTGTYGLLQEIESEPRTKKKSQVGSDVFGFKAKYLGKGWTGSVKWEALDSNSNYRSQQMQGAFEWEI